MLHTRKRITRKELLKPDQFFNFTGWFLRFVRTNRVGIIIIASLVVAAAGGVGGWRFYQTKQDLQAAQAYSTALEAYRKGQYENTLDLLARVNAPRGSIYQKLTLLYQAHSHIELKRPSEAIPLLTEFNAREHSQSYLKEIGLMSLGYAQEATGECISAIANFDRAAKLSGLLEEEAIMSKARCSTQSGATTAAVEAYREYLASFPGSSNELEITIKIQELEARIGKTPAEDK
jgi:predicted negative regulator of RcsB-dependent stress response